MFFNYGRSTQLPHPTFVYTGLDPFFQDRSFFSDLGNPNLDPDVSIGLGGTIVQDEPVSTEDFWITGMTVQKSFKYGISLFAGVDNISDYVEETLGDPSFDYNWGPLRGRYYYGGLSYTLDD